MNKLENSIISATTSTTMMTVFSYVVSLAEKENFSEPEHLGTLIHRLLPSRSKENAYAAGWVAHYATSLLFISIYQELWKTGKVKKNVSNGAILGFLNGLLGVFIWKATLKGHPAPPKINLTRYFLQMVPAHIIFAVCATLTSRLLDDKMK